MAGKKIKRNCLFILIDCLRSDKCWGKDKTNKTPTLDLLRSRGTFFPQVISTTTTTTPSVASLFTGVYPPIHGIRSLSGYKLDVKLKTIAEIFKENGYNTYAEVTGPLVPEVGLNRGFDYYNLREKSEGLYSKWYEELLSKIESKKLKEPWFLFLHLWELHDLMIAKGFNNRKFGKNRYERALSSIDAYLMYLMRIIDDNTIIVLHGDHGEKIAETLFEDYVLNNFRIFFWWLKRKIKLARKEERLHLVGHGFHVYDYLIKVPLILVGKNILPANKIITKQVRQVDILPTIVDILNLEYNSSSQLNGRSLVHLIDGKDEEEPPAYCEACGVVLPDKTKWLSAIRTPTYKFIYGPYSNDIPQELYDLKNDPYEKVNIVNKHPDLARKFKRMIEDIISIHEKDEIKSVIKRLKLQGKI